jgi:hypothetical protein
LLYLDNKLNMVTRLLKQKDVRKKFNEVFKKPDIKDFSILDNPIDYNAPLLGNALDYFITCHFNYLNKSETDSLIEKADFWIKELKRTRPLQNSNGKFEEVCYNCYKSRNGVICYHLTYGSKSQVEGHIRFIRGEVIYCYTPKEISSLIEESLIKYKTYKGKLSDQFLNSILILAQILPGIKLHGLARNIGKPDKADLLMLKHLIKQIPKNLFVSKSVLASPNLNHGTILGEPDYIIDDMILDIKTTKKLFSNADYHQLICYYLLYLIKEKAWFKNRIKINRIGIYYALHGQLIQFKISELCDPKEFKGVIDLLKIKSKNYDYY